MLQGIHLRPHGDTRIKVIDADRLCDAGCLQCHDVVDLLSCTKLMMKRHVTDLNVDYKATLNAIRRYTFRIGKNSLQSKRPRNIHYARGVVPTDRSNNVNASSNANKASTSASLSSSSATSDEFNAPTL